MTETLGQALREGDRLGVRYERMLRHPPERVWRALTESEHLAAWFPADIVGSRRAGAAIDVVFWPAMVERYSIEETVVPGHILSWDPFSRFEYDWGGDVVRFDLEPVDGGTQLVLVVWLGEESLQTGSHRAAAGYHRCLDALVAHLEPGEDLSLLDVETAALEAEYEQLVGLTD